MDQLASQYLVDILNSEMVLASTPAKTAFLRDQNFKFPTSDGLFVVLGVVNAQPISAKSYIVPGGVENWDQKGGFWDVLGQQFDLEGNYLNYDRDGETWDNPNQTWDQLPPTNFEIQEVQFLENIQVDICSRNNDALMRNWEVVAALNSIRSKQTQEKYNFKICRLSRGPVNTSAAEGGYQLIRFTLTFSVFAWYRKVKMLTATADFGDYYDDFKTRIDDARTIGHNVTNYDQQPPQNWDTGELFDQRPPVATFEINQEGIEP